MGINLVAGLIKIQFDDAGAPTGICTGKDLRAIVSHAFSIWMKELTLFHLYCLSVVFAI